MKRRPLLLAGAAASVARFSAAQTPSQKIAQTPTPAPAIDWPAIHLLDGSTLTPSSWQGQAAVVVFWATYCPFCKRHNAHVDKLHRALQGQALRVLGVALDGDADAVRRYMAGNGYQFPVTLDDGTLRKRFTARRVIPMTCVLDRQGRLLQAIPGEMFEDDVMGLARVLLRATPVS
jgi:thiol-disulfide isomerase/thioredoxin